MVHGLILLGGRETHGILQDAIDLLRQLMVVLLEAVVGDLMPALGSAPGVLRNGFLQRT